MYSRDEGIADKYEVSSWLRDADNRQITCKDIVASVSGMKYREREFTAAFCALELMGCEGELNFLISQFLNNSSSRKKRFALQFIGATGRSTFRSDVIAAQGDSSHDVSTSANEALLMLDSHSNDEAVNKIQP
jgi:hypothetical protein